MATSTSNETDPLLGFQPREPHQAADGSEAIHPSAQPEPSETRRSLRPSTIPFRIAAAMFSFAVLGVTVSTIGVMIPHLEAFYHLTDKEVALIFLAAPLGYLPATYVNGSIHLSLGQRGIAIIAPVSHILWAMASALRPPFVVFLITTAVGFFGGALLDASWCAWAGGMKSNANMVQGFLHGSFSVGAGLGPVIAGSLIEVGQAPWYVWYYFVAGISLVELLLLFLAFRAEDAQRYREEKYDVLLPTEHHGDSRAIFRHSVIWICAVYLLSYAALETTVSGWIVAFMTRARHSSAYLASICSSGFWVGQAVGRLSLGAVTDKIGVKVAVTIYLVCAIASEALFSISHAPAVSIAAMALLGFFCGPLYPSGIVSMTQLLPSNLHVPANSVVALIGQTGGALLPFGLGVMADTLGIGIFETFILVDTVVVLLVWAAFPRRRVRVESVVDEEEEAPVLDH